MRVFAIEFEISLSLWKSAQTIVYRFFRNDLAHETKINDIHKCHLHEKRKFQFHIRTVAHTHTQCLPCIAIVHPRKRVRYLFLNI